MKRNIYSYISHKARRSLILPVIAAAAMIIILLLVPFKSVLAPYECSGSSEIMNALDSGMLYINFTASGLKYTGYDHIVAGKTAASYYYIMNEKNGESRCLFFLIPNSRSQKDAIDTFSGRARIIKSSPSFDEFTGKYAEEIGWPASGLSEISGGALISCYDYHGTLYIILLILLGLILLMSIAAFAVNAAIAAHPKLHSSLRSISIYGLDSSDLDAVNSELEHDCMIEAGKLFATENYLIAFSGNAVHIVPIHNITWAYRTAFRPRLAQKKKRCSLVIAATPEQVIQIPRCPVDDAGAILRFLSEDFSHITVGYKRGIKNGLKEDIQ